MPDPQPPLLKFQHLHKKPFSLDIASLLHGGLRAGAPGLHLRFFSGLASLSYLYPCEAFFSFPRICNAPTAIAPLFFEGLPVLLLILLRFGKSCETFFPLLGVWDLQTALLAALFDGLPELAFFLGLLALSLPFFIEPRPLYLGNDKGSRGQVIVICVR